jgi:acetyl coenzyme A synthetase (ADP forming)-like protein
MAGSLAAFFAPRSVAVIGASRDPSKVGGSVLANLKAAGFAGRVMPVNPGASTVQGLPAVPSVGDLEEAVDLVVIAVPAAHVLSTLKECVAQGVPGAVVISAGFREIGGEGQAREAELRAWLRDQPIRVLGPNCLGWIRPGHKLNVTFAPGMPRPGHVAFISHSGALAVAILDWSRERPMGFSLFASLGNQADLTETDVLAAVAEDPETQVIVAYLEGVADGRRFFESLTILTPTKPVVVLKAGRSVEAARAVTSHTGALAGSDRAFDAAVKQAGAVRVHSVEALFDLAHALERQPVPKGRRLAVVTNGGGLGIVATDAARDAGLVVSPLGPDIEARLRAVLPPTASVANPVDLVGDADAARFHNVLHALGGALVVDATVVLLTAQAATDSATVARAIASATRGWTIPVVAAFVGGTRVAPGAAALEEAGIPSYPFPERAVAALGGMTRVGEARRERPAEAPATASPDDVRRHLHALREARSERVGLLDLQPALAAYGIRVAPARLATTAEDAAAAAAQIGFPIALKIVSPDITHKTDVGGVRLGLVSAAEVAEAARAMLDRARRERPQAHITGVLLQPMVSRSRELLLGVVRDPQFGPMVVVGLGGIYVEVLNDTSARLAPVTQAEAREMLEELRTAPLLHGVRGEPPVDLPALAETISRFSSLAVDLSDLAEIELNPLMAGPDGVVAVDARATLTPITAQEARR